jgi:hypothetical protein
MILPAKGTAKSKKYLDFVFIIDYNAATKIGPSYIRMWAMSIRSASAWIESEYGMAGEYERSRKAKSNEIR